MNIILLQTQLALAEIDLLLKEFPQFLFLSLSEASYKNLTPVHWGRLEVLFGSRLTREELALAHQLRWIHAPTAHLNRLCMDEIEEQGNILVTNTIDENVTQTGEFVIGSVLAFAKNLLAWSELDKTPAYVWDSKKRDTMWTLPGKTFLQIGLGKVGTEIARRARGENMRVWGVQHHRSFHRYCHKVFSTQEINSLLPLVDVVSIALPRAKEYQNWLQKSELDLMKKDSILIVLGAANLIKEEDLVACASKGKFRGIVLDYIYQNPLKPTSLLWTLPNTIITPDVAPRPKSTERVAFKIFVYNLRQYLHGNFKDMRNVIEKTALIIPDQ